MHFINPMMLWLLAIVPPLGSAGVWLAWRRKRALQDHFGEEPLVSRLSKVPTSQHYQLKALWVFLGLVSLMVALSRPYLKTGSIALPRGTIDVIAVVDVSRSMAARDYQGKLAGKYYQGGTRLDMARYLLAHDVIASLSGNRLGVVSFAGDSFPLAFLTDDMQAMGWVLNRALTIGSAPGEGSALAKSFKLAFQMFDLDSSPSHRKIIVLFSDGGNSDSASVLESVIRECRKRGIQLVVAGLGRTTPSAIPVSQLSLRDQQEESGKKWFEIDGEVVQTALDENLLRFMAKATGGRYVRVSTAADFHMGLLISRSEVVHKKGKQELFSYALMGSLLFAVLMLVTTWEIRPASVDQSRFNSEHK